MSRFCAALFFISFAAVVRAADPFAGYFYPSGIQAGTTNRIIVGGLILVMMAAGFDLQIM